MCGVRAYGCVVCGRNGECSVWGMGVWSVGVRGVCSVWGVEHRCEGCV